jgi:hypothetical protein
MFDKRRILRKGSTAKALVASVVEESTWLSNGYRTYVHAVQVRATDRPPFETTIRHKFDLTDPRPRTGAVLDVRYDPKTLEAVFVLAGDPRYDPDAMNARSEARYAGLPEAARDRPAG